MRGSNNTAGPHRSPPTAEPIIPDRCYPLRALGQWGIGARGIQALKRAGMTFLRFGKLRFFLGQDLIDVLQPVVTADEPTGTDAGWTRPDRAAKMPPEEKSQPPD